MRNTILFRSIFLNRYPNRKKNKPVNILPNQVEYLYHSILYNKNAKEKLINTEINAIIFRLNLYWIFRQKSPNCLTKNKLNKNHKALFPGIFPAFKKERIGFMKQSISNKEPLISQSLKMY